MKLPLINVFDPVYEAWTTRDATSEEMQLHYQEHGYLSLHVNDTLIARIDNHIDAAVHMAKYQVDNGLENSIDTHLDISSTYRFWRQQMPSKTPDDIAKFQQQYPHYNHPGVDKEINKIGCTLSDGQYLFHGGFWSINAPHQFTLVKPFSTSFCPQVALRNAEWRAKAYDAGQIDLLVLRAINPKTNIFVFRKNGTRMGNEKEVLFASGANIMLRNRILVRTDYPASKHNQPQKLIPIYVNEVDIS